MMKKIHILLFVILMLIGCKSGNNENSDNSLGNAVYHWKTTFNPDSEELKFLSDHKVNHIYLHAFDIVEADGQIVPVATVGIDWECEQNLPDTLKITPTVFITNEAMKEISTFDYYSYYDDAPTQYEIYAQKIVKRIGAMMKYHEMDHRVVGIQIDCDWTADTQDAYFNLLKEIDKSMSAEFPDKQNLKLSSTIRLHQLRMTPPPCDYGVLMLYNTGSVKNVETENSILNEKDVEPYLKYKDYSLHLDFAYPTFSWGVWFRDNEFKALLRSSDFSDTTLYEKSGGNKVKVIADHVRENHNLKKNDIIRIEQSNITDVLGVKSAVEKNLKDENSATIIYHWDSSNLSKYTKDEISKIYNAD